MQALQETELWDPTSFHHASLALFTDFLRKTLPQFFKMLICRLGFIYGLGTMVLYHTAFLHFRNS
jgi:hypothetical protein